MSANVPETKVITNKLQKNISTVSDVNEPCGSRERVTNRCLSELWGLTVMTGGGNEAPGILRCTMNLEWLIASCYASVHSEKTQQLLLKIWSLLDLRFMNNMTSFAILTSHNLTHKFHETSGGGQTNFDINYIVAFSCGNLTKTNIKTTPYTKKWFVKKFFPKFSLEEHH